MSQTTTLVVRKQSPSKATLVLKMNEPVLQSRWWFGGISGAGACCFTHPLDLLKVILQTKGENKGNLFRTTLHVVKENGVLSLWNGISASLLRQLTYSTTRFAIYDLVKSEITSSTGVEMPSYQKIALAGFAGFIGGFVGCPGDMMNVRMQNDVKLIAAEKRNYKNAFHGIFRVGREEGWSKIFSGATMAMSRGAIVSIGQIAAYDQYKDFLTGFPEMFSDKSVLTHFTASLLSGTTATIITQPLDVMKTRMMANKGEYKSILHCAKEIWKENRVLGFFKGFVPAFVRLAPHTILMFIFKEQLTQHFGYEK